jgi:hypothetical protein
MVTLPPSNRGGAMSSIVNLMALPDATFSVLQSTLPAAVPVHCGGREETPMSAGPSMPITMSRATAVRFESVTFSGKARDGFSGWRPAGMERRTAVPGGGTLPDVAAGGSSKTKRDAPATAILTRKRYTARTSTGTYNPPPPCQNELL